MWFFGMTLLIVGVVAFVMKLVDLYYGELEKGGWDD